MLTRDSKIIDVVNEYPSSLLVFQQYGLGCVGCMLSQSETISEGAAAHGIDVDELIESIIELDNYAKKLDEEEAEETVVEEEVVE